MMAANDYMNTELRQGMQAMRQRYVGPAGVSAARPGTPLNPGAAPRSPTSAAPGFTIHPPGVPTNPREFNYEPQPDNSWKLYPPGVQAPDSAIQASMPRAATTQDLMRMRQEMSGFMNPRTQGG
jgi:hypothetical protein